MLYALLCTLRSAPRVPQCYLFSFNQLCTLSCSSVQVVGVSILVNWTYLEPSGLVIICLVYIYQFINSSNLTCLLTIVCSLDGSSLNSLSELRSKDPRSINLHVILSKCFILLLFIIIYYYLFFIVQSRIYLCID
jgi:hypothetical protein